MPTGPLNGAIEEIIGCAPVTLKFTLLLVPLEFVTYTPYVPGVTSCEGAAQLMPILLLMKSHGPTACGTVNTMVLPSLDPRLEIPPLPKWILLPVEVNPEPLIVTVAPIGSYDGERNEMHNFCIGGVIGLEDPPPPTMTDPTPVVDVVIAGDCPFAAAPCPTPPEVAYGVIVVGEQPYDGGGRIGGVVPPAQPYNAFNFALVALPA